MKHLVKVASVAVGAGMCGGLVHWFQGVDPSVFPPDVTGLGTILIGTIVPALAGLYLKRPHDA